MGKKKKGKYGVQTRSPLQYQPPLKQKKKARFSVGMKILSAVFVFIIIGGIAYWRLSPQSTSSPNSVPTPQYPQTAAGIFYSNPTIAPTGTKGSLPYGFANQNKLVFLDLKLQGEIGELTYQGRTIPLSQYKDGAYLPLVVILTPSQKLVSAIRVCEPCGSFSFHIVQGKYLDCDACHTRWDIETLKGVSGGCTEYPPLKLSSSITNGSIEIDLSPLGIRVTS